jgi:hypothetical protein
MDNVSQLRGICTSSSGKPSIGVQFVAGRHVWPVVLGEDLTNDFSTAAHPDLVEDRLEMIPDGGSGLCSFLQFCREIRSGGTRIRTGDTMIFS